MSIRKVEMVLILVVTAVVLVCVLVVYASHARSENSAMYCRYYAKGVATGFSLNTAEQENGSSRVSLRIRADMSMMMSFGDRSIQHRQALNQSWATASKMYKAAYEECASLN